MVRSSWSSRTARAWRWWTCSCISPSARRASWGELEQSAAQETTNIVGCAYLNALAAHLPGKISRDSPASEELVPTPPTFLHEFAGSLLEFALMEQALELDQVLLIHTSVRVGPAGTEPELDAAVHPRSCVAARAGSRADRAGNALTARCESCPLLVLLVHQDRRQSSPWRSASGQSPPRRRRSGRCLGSCVGVILHDRVARLGGLAHIVLPDSRGSTDHPGKFADTAIPAMIGEIERTASGQGARPPGRQARGRREHVPDRWQCEPGA